MRGGCWQTTRESLLETHQQGNRFGPRSLFQVDKAWSRLGARLGRVCTTFEARQPPSLAGCRNPVFCFSRWSCRGNLFMVRSASWEQATHARSISASIPGILLTDTPRSDSPRQCWSAACVRTGFSTTLMLTSAFERRSEFDSLSQGKNALHAFLEY